MCKYPVGLGAKRTRTVICFFDLKIATQLLVHIARERRQLTVRLSGVARLAAMRLVIQPLHYRWGLCECLPLRSGRSVAWLARLLGVQEVESSNLSAPTISLTINLLDVFLRYWA